MNHVQVARAALSYCLCHGSRDSHPSSTRHLWGPQIHSIRSALAMDSQGRGMVEDMINRDALIKHASAMSNDIRSHWINQLDGGKLAVDLEMIV